MASSCEYGHIELTFSADRWIKGRICDDRFEPRPGDLPTQSGEPELDATGQPPDPPALNKLTTKDALGLLHSSKYALSGERYTKFVVPLERQAYAWHRHDQVLQLLRRWHPSQIFDTEMGKIEVFDLTAKK